MVLSIKGAQIADVYSGVFRQADVFIEDGIIIEERDAGGANTVDETIDASGKYLLPAFIDSHIHIESSFLKPSELGRLLLPHGTGTIISDPHEIVNVCGLAGLDWMLEDAKNAPIDIKFAMPSCVPVTAFEDNGTEPVTAALMEKYFADPAYKDRIIALGEVMNYKAVIVGDTDMQQKLSLAKRYGKIIDGHSPGLKGPDLQKYASAGVQTDHECSTQEEMQERLALGMYVQLRYGSAAKNMLNLLPGLVKDDVKNFRHCLLCTDDLSVETITEEGHIDNLLRLAVAHGLPAIEAVRMVTLNAAECYGLKDRGAMAPGLRADLVLVDDVRDFRVFRVFNSHERHKQHEPFEQIPEHNLKYTINIKDFGVDKLKVDVDSPVIGVHPDTLITDWGVWADNYPPIRRGRFKTCPYMPHGNPNGIPHNAPNKIAVIERHRGTGLASAALVQGFGLQEGAIAQSIAHDSHNIIALGADGLNGSTDKDMVFAVRRLEALNGGIVIVADEKVLAELPLSIAGLVSSLPGEQVAEKFKAIKAATEELGMPPSFEPVLNLAFMSLIVIPHLKITCRGLFDVDRFTFLK
ncbi:MAG: adenine deaminase [Spirochaetaceae bacterium]|jgi:adenine deaminase|nr:adenine deaminase [Spirochaetaceae bacterium]